jgi:OOP family OmpA-OmpF porin
MKKYIYLLMLTFFSSSVLAEGFYAGIGYLKSDVNTHKYPSLTYSAYDDEDDGFTIFGGYDFNERFGIEAGYNDLGETTATVTTGPTTANKEITVTTLAGVLKTDPIAENIVLFVKAGLAYIDHDEQVVGGAAPSEETTNTYFGIGANFELPNGLIVRGLYEEYGEDDGQTDINGANVDQIDPDVMSLSLIKRF